MKTLRHRLAGPALLLASICAGCGGGSPAAPSAPSTPSALPTVDACAAVGGTASALVRIINGTSCSTANTSVVLLNMRDKNDLPVAACSGTIIAPRAVLTAAHCLADSDTAMVKIYLGIGAQILASSFQASPGYRKNDSSSLDAGIVLTSEDLPRPAVPLLASRNAVVGERAVIAGWGKDSDGGLATLKAGTTAVSAVGTYFLQTQPSSGSGVCSGDSGGPLLLSQQNGWAIAGIASATSTGDCTTATNYYATLRNPDILSFVLGLVPGAERK